MNGGGIDPRLSPLKNDERAAAVACSIVTMDVYI